MRSQLNKRQQAERKGRWAEYYAAVYLTLKGYKILALRWKSRMGEIDIIAEHQKAYIIIEVKARKTHQAALDAVTYQNRRRIEAASNIWFSTQATDKDYGIRFDIVTVSGAKIKHLKQAWFMAE